MASFPPIPQLVGKHGPIYEAYYKQADPKNTGSVGALDAATFLKKSGLKDTVLSQIWDLSDPSGKGYLEKPGFFVALKLIALSQNGLELGVNKLANETPQPNLGPVEIAPEVDPSAGVGGPWALNASEKAKYDQVFDSLHPVNNLLGGDKVRPVLLNSKLPVDILGRIWELSDIDKDGYLDRDEFAVAMHLVHKGMAKEPLPAVLPPGLVPPSKRKVIPGARLPGAIQVLPGLVGPGGGIHTPPQRSGSPSLRGMDVWIVTPAEKANYDIMFRKADLDLDGYVSGQEIRDIFLQSGLQNHVLAHIWSLCDMKGLGKLTSDQFALAMHLVQLKMKGVDPPPHLTPEMIPPSMRSGTTADTTTFGVADGGTSAGPYGHVADFSAIKELDLIQKEIDDIKKEKLKLEAGQQQQTADIRICQGEVQTLEKELNSVTTTLHQLESQKKDAQKCLDELEEKKSDLETSVREVKAKCEEEQKQINSLNEHLRNQEKSAMDQDEELNKLRIDLSRLREEENQLEQRVESGKQQMEQLAKSHKDLLLQVNQTKARLQHMQDQHRAVQQGVTELSMTNDISSSPSFTPGLYDTSSPAFSASFTSNTPTFDEQFSTRATQGSPVSTISDFSMGSIVDEDPFKNKDPFGGGGTQVDPFTADDPFKSSDPFKSTDGFTADPFASDDPFKDAFSSSSNSATKDDPFFNADPFGGSFTSSSSSFSKKSAADAFDPFGTATASKPQKSSGDLFGTDPFAPSPAKSGSESPRPALPPKQKKAPPPRPAPPMGKSPAASPSKPSKPSPFGGFPSDPFGSSDPFSGSSTGTSTASVFSNDEPGWAFTSSTTETTPTSTTDSSSKKKSSHSKSPKSPSSKSSQKSKSPSAKSQPKLSKREQEEADFQFALKLSRGEINDTDA